MDPDFFGSMALEGLGLRKKKDKKLSFHPVTLFTIYMILVKSFILFKSQFCHL